MKLFYADIVRGGRVALLAGPFPSEDVARKYAQPASLKAAELDPRAHFDPFGVVGVESEVYSKPGKINHLLEIEAGDLVKLCQSCSLQLAHPGARECLDCAVEAADDIFAGVY